MTTSLAIIKIASAIPLKKPPFSSTFTSGRKYLSLFLTSDSWETVKIILEIILLMRFILPSRFIVEWHRFSLRISYFDFLPAYPPFWYLENLQTLKILTIFVQILNILVYISYVSQNITTFNFINSIVLFESMITLRIVTKIMLSCILFVSFFFLFFYEIFIVLLFTDIPCVYLYIYVHIQNDNRMRYSLFIII